jgi:hypothetical protein
MESEQAPSGFVKERRGRSIAAACMYKEDRVKMHI